ncbi:hypothetical protein WDW89_21990 [Deltaproteobacteria bacterium TL4]
MPSEKLVFYLSDEIFAINTPILVTIDAQSTAILKIELASDRSMETWRRHFESLGDHLFVSLGMASDRGTGVVAGYKAALELALWVCDYFHEFRDLYKLLIQLEKKACARITEEEERAKVFENAKSEANLQKRFKQYEEACRVCEHSIEIYDQLDYLTQLLREILQFCSPQGGRPRDEVKSQLWSVFDLIEEIDHPAIKDMIKSLNDHLDDILVPFGELDKIHAQLMETIPQDCLEYLYMAWHHEHFSHQSKSQQKRYHQSERDFWFELAEGILQEEFLQAKTLVFEKLDSVIRSSSLVEMVNSLIRPYLNNSKGQISQEMLNLVMFYHNHRRYKSGKRKGKAPIELLTGEELEAHWSELLLQEIKDKETDDNSNLSQRAPLLKLVVNHKEEMRQRPATSQSNGNGYKEYLDSAYQKIETDAA